MACEMTNPFLKLMQRHDDELKQDVHPGCRNYQGRYPDEVLRKALDKHYKYKSYVSLGNSKPLTSTMGIGMSRLQFGDSDYAQATLELQRLPMLSSFMTDRLPEIEEPVPVTRTLLRTPAGTQVASYRTNITGVRGHSFTETLSGTLSGAFSSSTSGTVSSTVNSTVSGANASSGLLNTGCVTSSCLTGITSRPSVCFRETGSNLAAILAATESNDGERDATESWGPLESRPSEPGSTGRDLGASWPRPVSRRSLGASAAASRAASFTGEVDTPDACSCGRGRSSGGSGSPQRRPSLPPPELAAVMSLQQQLQQRLQLQPSPCIIRRESLGAERSVSRPLLSQQSQRPYPPLPMPSPLVQSPPPPLQLPQHQQQVNAVSPFSSQSGFSQVGDYQRSCGGGNPAPAPVGGLVPQLQQQQSVPQLPGHVQSGGDMVREDIPRHKRASMVAVYGNSSSHQQQIQLLKMPRASDSTSTSTWGGESPQGLQRQSICLRRHHSIGRGGASGSENGEPFEREITSAAGDNRCTISPNGTEGSDFGGASSSDQLVSGIPAIRPMTAADIAVINEATRRYHFPQPTEQQQDSAEGAFVAAASLKSLTRTVSVRRNDRPPSPTVPATAAGAASTERADDLLRALRSPEPPSSGCSGFYMGAVGRPTGKCDVQLSSDVHSGAVGEGHLALRPPLAVASKKLGTSGSFRRSNSIRPRNSQSTVDVAVPAAAAGVEDSQDQGGDAGSTSRSSRSVLATPLVANTTLEPNPLDALSPSSPLSDGSNSVDLASERAGSPVEAVHSWEDSAGQHGTGGDEGGGSVGSSGGGRGGVYGAGDGDEGRGGRGDHAAAPNADGVATVGMPIGSVRSSAALRGWSSKKELLASPFSSSKLRRSTTDAVPVQQQYNDLDGVGTLQQQQQPVLRQLPTSLSASGCLNVPGSTATALATAVACISTSLKAARVTGGSGPGRESTSACDDDDDNDDDDGDRSCDSSDCKTDEVSGSGDTAPAEAAGGPQAAGLPPGLQRLMRMSGLRSDIRNLLKASEKVMLIRNFKQAEKTAAAVKVKEQGWRKS